MDTLHRRITNRQGLGDGFFNLALLIQRRHLGKTAAIDVPLAANFVQ